MATGDDKEKTAQNKSEAAAQKASAKKAPGAEKAVKAGPKGKPEKAARAPKGEPRGAARKAATPVSRPRRVVGAEGGENDARKARAQARYVRMAPRKLRLVMDAIRGKSVAEARGILRFCGKRAAGPLAKVLESAVANAENNHSMDTSSLVITTAFVDQGPSFKSWIPRARGRASAVHKFTSHITIEVKEREEA